MKRLPILALLLIAAPASATLSEQQLATAVARPPAGARLPAGLRFVDQQGQPTTLAQAAGGKPLVLLFVDYTCTHLCGPGLTLTAGALTDAGLAIGRDYALATVGIDPKDRIDDAQAMARMRLSSLPAIASNIRLLTGNAATIAAATRALGYGYVYDAAHDQYAHDASVYVFARDGHLAAMLPELGIVPATVGAAVRNADQTTPQPSIAEQVVHLCYGFAAAHGRFGKAIVWGMQGGAVALLVLMALGVRRLVRRTAAV